jgi:hypothetical protein
MLMEIYRRGLLTGNNSKVKIQKSEVRGQKSKVKIQKSKVKKLQGGNEGNKGTMF